MKPDRLVELAEAEGITLSMLQALCDFEPGIWYGMAYPTRRAAAHKGHMVRMGLAERDGGFPHSNYRLTRDGERLRAASLRATAQMMGEK